MNAQTAKDLATVLFACFIYGGFALTNWGCMLHEFYDWRFGQFIFMTLNFITFVMAFVALGRRGK